MFDEIDTRHPTDPSQLFQYPVGKSKMSLKGGSVFGALTIRQNSIGLMTIEQCVLDTNAGKQLSRAATDV